MKLHDNMAKQKLKTFSTINTKKSRTKGQNVVLKAGRNLFSHIILVAEIRSVNMEDIVSRPLGPLSGALANADASVRKTNKAALARELEKNVSPAEAIHIQSTCIIDAGTKAELQQQRICSSGRVCIVHGTVCGWTEW